MKKIIAIVLAVVLVVGGVSGGVYWKTRSGNKTVSVYPVSDDMISTTYWGDESSSYGPVTTDRTQSVYLSDTQTVEKILVTEGQTVKKGDVLMTYDTTLSQVEVEKKSLEIQSMQLDLTTAKENLAKIQKYRPGKTIAEKDLVDDTSLSGGYDTSSDSGDDEMKADTPAVQTGLTIQSWKVMGKLLSTDLTDPGTGSGNDGKTEEGSGTEENSKSSESNDADESDKSSESSGADESGKSSESSDTDESSKSSESSDTDESSKSSESSGADESGSIIYPTLLDGLGSKESDPFVYDWNSKWEIDQAMLAHLSQGRTNTYVVLQVNPDGIGEVQKTKTQDASQSTAGDKDEETGTNKTKVVYPKGSWMEILIHRTTEGYTYQMISMCVDGKEISLQNGKIKQDTEEQETKPSADETEADETEAETEAETETETEAETEEYDEPSYGGSSGISYTASEISEMLSEAKEKVRDLDLEIRIAQVEYERMERELNDGSVVSQIDGVVKSVVDEDTAKTEGTALINVSGGGGYYVTGTVSELDLDDVQPGMIVSVMSWENYETYEGTVTEISEYPNTSSYYDGSGNSNVSYYNFTVFVDESAELQEYDYVQITYTPESDDGENIYVLSCMIRTENGTSYVYVDNGEGKLEKRTVRTGKSLWGSYTEVCSGLTTDDMIAFPYGTNLKEGADTVQAEPDELFSY